MSTLPVLRGLTLTDTPRLVASRQGWPQAAPVLRQYGLSSPEWLAQVAAALGLRHCRVCLRPFIAVSPRVRFCSDRCADGAYLLTLSPAKRRQLRSRRRERRAFANA